MVPRKMAVGLTLPTLHIHGMYYYYGTHMSIYKYIYHSSSYLYTHGSDRSCRHLKPSSRISGIRPGLADEAPLRSCKSLKKAQTLLYKIQQKTATEMLIPTWKIYEYIVQRFSYYALALSEAAILTRARLLMCLNSIIVFEGAGA